MAKSLLAAVLVAGGVLVPVGVAQAHPMTDGGRPGMPPGMQQMHELMQQGNPGMQRMHELMQQGNPGMKKMHERMHGEMPTHR